MADCFCKDWIENIAKVNGPLIQLHLRTGGKGYDGKPFTHCPWCGNSLIPAADEHGIKIGDRVRISLGASCTIPADGWTVYGLPTRAWPNYKVKHDNGGDMTISRDYVHPL